MHQASSSSSSSWWKFTIVIIHGIIYHIINHVSSLIAQPLDIVKALRPTRPSQQLVRNPPTVLQSHRGKDGYLEPIEVPIHWHGEDHANWVLASKSAGNIDVELQSPDDQLHELPYSNHQFEHKEPPRLRGYKSYPLLPPLYLEHCEVNSRVANYHHHWAYKSHGRGLTGRRMPLASLYHGWHPALQPSWCKTGPRLYDLHAPHPTPKKIILPVQAISPNSVHSAILKQLKSLKHQVFPCSIAHLPPLKRSCQIIKDVKSPTSWQNGTRPQKVHGPGNCPPFS